MTTSAIRFSTIRQWGGSQDRAFEELCYQLLQEPEDLPQAGGRPVRVGNPDGGVEWYLDLPDGSQWGWQAKFIFEVNHLLAAMERTVRRVVLDRPRLRRLTFCVPINLSGGSSGGSRTPGRTKLERRVKSWKAAIPGADAIEVVLSQESDLLSRLSLAKHRGRQWFWWDAVVLSESHLKRLHEEQVKVAGPRYRPELHVDLPIAGDLKALGLSDEYSARLTGLANRLATETRYFGVPNSWPQGEILTTFVAAVRHTMELRGLLSTMPLDAGLRDPLEQLCTTVDRTLQALRAAEGPLRAEVRAEEARKEEARKAQTADHAPQKVGSKLPGMESALHDISRALSVVWDLDEFLSTPASRAARSRSYFLTGEAGTGKTHLFLDACASALAEGRPAAVVFGFQFGRSDLFVGLASVVTHADVVLSRLVRARPTLAMIFSTVAVQTSGRG